MQNILYRTVAFLTIRKMKDAMTTEEILREMRKKHGLTQVELARAIKVGDQTVGAWERGRTAITLEDACKLADYYECSLDELAGRSHYITKHITREQAALNRNYEDMKPRSRSQLSAMAEGLARIDRADSSK